MNYYSVYIKEKGRDVWLLFENRLTNEEACKMRTAVERRFPTFEAEVFGLVLPGVRED
jgi:hypothetical protein